MRIKNYNDRDCIIDRISNHNDSNRRVGRGTKPTILCRKMWVERSATSLRYRSTHPTIYPSYARYMLAICCKEIPLEKEEAKMYLMEIYKEGADLPSQVRIFSPLTKNNLSYKALKEEVKQFEKEL